MRRYVRVVASDFKIVDEPAALAAVRNLKKPWWVDDEDYSRAKSLKEMLNLFEWHVKSDYMGEIVQVDYSAEDEFLLEILAPFVADGSFIEYSESGARWRNVFKGGKIHKVYPKLVWEEP